MENNQQKNKIIIRETSEKDVPLIMDFVKSMADFEKLSDKLLSTEEILKESLFGENIYAEAMIAELEGESAGFMIFFHNFSSFTGKPGLFIEDIFVHEKFRGLGIGKALMIHCAKIAKERNCGRIDWNVLDWNPARDFYEHCGGQCHDEWVVYRLEEKGINELSNQN